jgi:hypothetical protein
LSWNLHLLESLSIQLQVVVGKQNAIPDFGEKVNQKQLLLADADVLSSSWFVLSLLSSDQLWPRLIARDQLLKS